MNLIDSYVKIEIGNEFVRVDSSSEAVDFIDSMGLRNKYHENAYIKYILVKEYDDNTEDRTVLSSRVEDAIHEIRRFLKN